MCGIAGILDRGRGGGDPGQEALIRRMTDTLSHRGPDAAGVHCEPGIALGHRRLSIIDRADGQQPLTNEDGRVWTVFNGEIYNHAYLRERLQGLGHQFRTRCDTEVIVHAWEAWGEACVEHFRGMFSLAVWDSREQTLFLARDRLGKKPLCYAELADGRVLFGSEIKALLACPELPRDLDACAVEAYFAYGYVPDPQSIFAAVRKLPPGHTLTFRGGEGQARPRCYWSPRFTGDSELSPESAVEEMRDRLREAVSVRLESEVPLGAFLSGGVDSSAVVASMSELGGQPVDACSIAFGDPRYNEADHARSVATHLGLNHHLYELSPERFDLLDELALLFDEPFADPSALPTYEVSRVARQHVTVALSGDGGDEVLAGYRRYRGYAREAQIRDRLPGSLRRGLFAPLARWYPKADWAPRVFRAKATFEALAADPVAGYLRSVAVVDDAQRQQLFSDQLRGELQGYHAAEVLRRHAADAPSHDPVAFVQYLDLKTWLPGDILTKVDRASMAHGLEVRAPLLDHTLVEWAGGLPTDRKIREGQGKWLLKRAVEDHLPREILYRRKQGFDLPVAEWFRGPLRAPLRQALLGERLADSGFFDVDRLQVLLDEHQSGRRNHARPLWALLMFESFLRRSLER
ncbi:MAG: amidotransferase 1, exosortase A system-associated [Halorhodospira halophila]|uniref:XrtA/PEP-CTERM system amidotransferase n=1 Tax=Halorhodospira halophila TaxID=1053 RepID=UPI0026EA6A42|nr:XrtA/PEP-CTERM system amidotransferase [Halorhodospira halophila]MCC3751733.1 amidotransferase 1, exosortase A system-associated [Halorhodospira halophila]